MRKRLLVLVLSLGVPSVVLLPLAADAERPAKKAAADAGEARYDPANVTAISQYMETLVKGNQKYEEKDFPAAIDLYKKAAQLKPKDALAPYLMGEAYLASANLPEAEAAFKAAEEISDTRNPVLRAQVLFEVADVYERQKKWDLAKNAWKAYAEQAGKMKDGSAFPGSAEARIKAIDEWLALDKSYVAVRQRIEAEKAAAADAGKDAAAAKKK
jgi:hypothetical protein